MNKADRAELQKAHDMIEEAKSIIETIGEQEQEKFDNLTEGLQASERGQKFEETASSLADAAGALDDVLGAINDAMEG